MADVILKALTTTPNTTSSYENVGLSEYSNHSSTFPPFNISESSIKKPPLNDKGYYIDDVDDGLNDLQVLLLACFATLIPLIISVVAAFGIRILWVKYRKRRKGSSYDGMLEREGTSESLNKPLHSHLLNSDKLCSDTHLDICTEEVEICDSTTLNTSQVRSNHSSTNGSIITMTLKNNHLIVETEERNDIEADSRETTMKYSPGARDGIFIVEVQQGVRRSPTVVSTATSSNFNVAVKIDDQCALVHNSADSSSEDLPIEEPDDLGYIETVYSSQSQKLTNTGLTQSNSSLSHPSYSYTDQQCYDNEGYGYNLYKGYLNDEPLKKLHFNQKLKITSAVYKNPSKSIDLESPADGFLLSDREAAARCVLAEESGVNRNQNDVEINKKLKGSKNGDSIDNCASQTGAS